MRHLLSQCILWLILKLSPITVLRNIEVSVTLLQTSHRRLPYFEETAFLCNGHN